MNNKLILEQAYDILDLCETGHLCDYNLNLSEKICNVPLYRGMLFPIEWIKEGNIIQEWGDNCTHWSLDKNMAKYFALNTDGDGFVEDFGYERGFTTFEECKKLFKPVILCLQGKQKVLPLYDWMLVLKENGFPVNETYLLEKEYLISGYDFVIQKVVKDILYVKSVKHK